LAGSDTPRAAWRKLRRPFAFIAIPTNFLLDFLFVFTGSLLFFSTDVALLRSVQGRASYARRMEVARLSPRSSNRRDGNPALRVPARGAVSIRPREHDHPILGARRAPAVAAFVFSPPAAVVQLNELKSRS
jgi:hypothetical protein